MIKRSNSLGISALICGILFAQFSIAAIPSPSERIAQTIRHELYVTLESGNSFAKLMDRWNGTYGIDAVSPLIQVADDSALPDSARYAALMGAARMGGTAVSTLIVPFLKDHSWMLRSGALRALATLGNEKTASAVLPLIHDPALVVRVEAVLAIERLKPVGAVKALLSALNSPENYHANIAQWVPGRALQALKTLRAKEAAVGLRPLLSHSRDPELQLQTVETLEALLGKTYSPKLALSEKIERWNLLLTR